MKYRAQLLIINIGAFHEIRGDIKIHDIGFAEWCANYSDKSEVCRSIITSPIGGVGELFYTEVLIDIYIRGNREIQDKPA